MKRHQWSRLSHLQVGRFAEYFVKMELTMLGLDVYSAEVDDKGIDFVVRIDARTYLDVQVKSVRGLSYVFFPKDKFILRDNLLAAVVLLLQDQPPELYLLPSLAWKQPNALLVDRDYEGLKSRPEWGMNLSQKNRPLLAPYAFSQSITRLCTPSGG